MDKVVIVGGGVGGLLVGRALRAQVNDVLGLERGEHLGNDFVSGHHRLYQDWASTFLKDLFPNVGWTHIEEASVEWRKGKWVTVDQEELSKGQQYFLGSSFFSPQAGFAEIFKQMAESLDKKFLRRKPVLVIDTKLKKLTCGDGTEIEYGKLIWCNSLEALFKACEEKAPKSFKGKKEGVEEGGLVLEMTFESPVFERLNTMVLPFRFKEKNLRALGNVESRSEGKVQYCWTLFLEEAISENREELAKCLRTFKRELFKQFPAAGKGLLHEKIVYLPSIFVEPNVEAKSTEIFEDVFYVGPLLRLVDGAPGAQCLDLLVENCQRTVAKFSFARTNEKSHILQADSAT